MIVVLGDWRAFALRGAAAVLFGVAALAWPDLTLTALVLLFGAFVLVHGITLLVDGFRAPDRRGLMVMGVVSVAVGIVTFLWPGITALALLYLIAAWALVTGGLDIFTAIDRRQDLTHWWLLAVGGALAVGVAVVLVITPGAGALAITWLIGWFALMEGALSLALAWQLRKLETEIDRAMSPRGTSWRAA